MKYINSLKYMNSFESAASYSDISQKRIMELCADLGRINIGNNGIFLPRGASAHATAVMLESVIKQAGYRVGRISSAYGLDSRSIVYIDGDIASIDDYNRAVAEIKALVLRKGENTYRAEEVSFAMALLICKMNACERIIFEGLSWDDCDMSALCAPYDLVIAPTVYSEKDGTLPLICNAIRNGVREVISGNQKKAAYDRISKACLTSGVRLTLTSKTNFRTESVSSIERTFSYGDRDGYTVKSPSKVICDCAMLVIESALAIRRDGIKMPWASIISGLRQATGMGCFEILSVSPLIMTDSAESDFEIELMISSYGEVFQGEGVQRLCFCIPSSAEKSVTALSKISESLLMVVGERSDLGEVGSGTYASCKDAAVHIMTLFKDGYDVICFGSVAFEREMKTELIKLMNN